MRKVDWVFWRGFESVGELGEGSDLGGETGSFWASWMFDWCVKLLRFWWRMFWLLLLR